MPPGERDVGDILALLPERYREDAGVRERVTRAWQYACRMHAGQRRRSGEPHTEHLYHTYKTLAEFELDPVTLIAGLLHDTLEDTAATEDELSGQFGDEVTHLVRGVTKLRSKANTARENSSETLHRLFRTAARDPRVLIIKLADRLHNMETLECMPPAKRARIARETLLIYVPVADRLGMHTIRRKLEDLSFGYAYPAAYAAVAPRFAKLVEGRMPAMERAKAALEAMLAERYGRPALVQLHIKALYRFYKKLERKGGDVKAINDVITQQVIIETVPDCYRVLGCVHALWKPVPGKLHDYIAFPKPNGYQALRTTVDAGPLGTIEVHLFSKENYNRARKGYALSIARGATRSAPPLWRQRGFLPALRRLFFPRTR